MRTPWGDTDRVEVIADGIYDVSTPRHGGIVLSTERIAQLPSGVTNFLNNRKYWEEDCDWCVPYIVFKDDIQKHGTAYKFIENLSMAYQIAKQCHPEIL